MQEVNARHVLIANRPPVETFGDLLAPLRDLHENASGHLVASEFSSALNNVSILSITDDDLVGLYGEALSLTLSCFWEVSKMGTRISKALSEPELSEDQGKQVVESYAEALADVGNRLNCLRMIHDAEMVAFTYEQHLQFWTEAIPTEGVSHRLPATLPIPVQALISRQLSAGITLGSEEGVTVLCRVATFLSGRFSISCKQAIRSTFSDRLCYGNAREANNRFFMDDALPDHGEQNPRRHLHRVLLLAALAVSSLVATEYVLLEIAGLPGPERDLNQEVPREVLMPELSLSCSLLASEVLEPLMQHQAILPGNHSTRVLLPARDCTKFLGDQIKASNSTYVMPELLAGQRAWNLWFNQVMLLPKMYDLEPLSTIQQLLTGVSANDDRIFEWHSTVAHKPVAFQTLANFTDHIRTCVMGRSTARHDAKVALLNLNRTYKDIPTCRALHVRIVQILELLFPVEKTVETEPITYSQAVQVVHALLSDLKKAHPIRGDLLLAWKAETQYNKSVLFNSFLLETLHQSLSPAASKALLDEYLKHAYALLEQAHMEYSQQKALPVSTAPADLSKQQVMALCATHLQVTPKVLAAAASASKKPAGKKSKKRDHVAAVGTGSKASTSRSTKGAKTDSDAPDYDLTARICDRIKENDPKLAPGTLRTKLPQLGQETAPVSSRGMLPHVPYPQARQLVLAGACPICLEKAYSVSSPDTLSESHHGYHECLKRRGVFQTKGSKHFMNAVVHPWIAAWKEAQSACTGAARR